MNGIKGKNEIGYLFSLLTLLSQKKGEKNASRVLELTLEIM